MSQIHYLPLTPGFFAILVGIFVNVLILRSEQGSCCTRLECIRFHGAGGGAPNGRANGSYRHGLYTRQAKAAGRLISELLRQCRKTIAVAGDL
jgi:hypothetical protein